MFPFTGSQIRRKGRQGLRCDAEEGDVALYKGWFRGVWSYEEDVIGIGEEEQETKDGEDLMRGDTV